MVKHATGEKSNKVKFNLHRAVHRNVISIVKPTRCTNISNLFYFGMTRYMFRPVFPSDFCLLAAANKQTEVSV